METSISAWILLHVVLCCITHLTEGLLRIEPAHREVSEGRTVTFICYARRQSGLVIFKYGSATPCTLQSNGEVFGKADGFSCGQQDADSYFIRIEHTNRTHRADNWRCQVGAELSNNAELVIKYPPSVVLTGNGETQRYVANQGDDVNFRCQVDAVPMGTVVIRTYENQLTPETNASMTSTTLTSVGCSHIRMYICEATNPLGNGKVSMELLVRCPPERVHNVPDTFYATEREDATLSISIRAFPRPIFTWRRPLGEVIQVSNGSLTIGAEYRDSLYLPRVENIDGGYYSVVVENGIGERNFTVLLNVKEGVNNGFLVGVAVGGVILFIFVIMFVCCIIKRLKHIKSDKEDMEEMDMDPLSEGTYRGENGRPPGDLYTEVKKPFKTKTVDDEIEEIKEGQKIGGDENGLTYVGVEVEEAPDNDVTAREPRTQYTEVDINQTTPLCNNGPDVVQVS